ncbi:ribonuclease H-like protein, partial [Exidia glandulosa HHB12029]
LLTRVMASALTNDESIMALYGAAPELECDHIYVYTDGSCVGQAETGARAGSGVCWGLGSDRNASYRAPGRQTSPRAEIYAVLQAVLHADRERALHIRTDSETNIRTFCYWAPSFAEAGWTCENADLIRATVYLLARRKAVTRFSWIKGHSGNALNDLADGLAAKG